MALYLGLDGGGSSSRVRVRGIDPAHRTTYETARRGGPLNVTTLAPAEWRATIDGLLAGFPEPTAAVVCIAGVRSTMSRRAVLRHLRVRFPAARLRVEPDFVAALECFDRPVATCVVAGTGSIVCSRDRHGGVATTGGEGPRLGDRGSAFRLGERALAYDPVVARAAMAGDGVSPAAVAALAPHLTRAADAGDPIARREVADEMAQLARVTVSHLDAHPPRRLRPRIGLVGSVWTSAAARTAYADALRAACPGVTLVRAVRQPVDAALALALACVTPP